jgi:hypothetical protein
MHFTLSCSSRTKAVDDASTECLDAQKPKIDEAKSLAVSRMRTLDSSEDKYRAKPKDETEVESPDDRYQPTKPAPTIVAVDQTISESRKKTIEKMELNTNSGSEDLIEKFVSDLNLSFQVKPGEETKAKEQNCTRGADPAESMWPIACLTNVFLKPVLAE